MTMLVNIVYILVLISILVLIYIKMQLSSIGLTITEFLEFIKANEVLEKLNNRTYTYQNFNDDDKLIFLIESERVFKIFDKVPNVLWEDLYPAYNNVLNTYRDIKLLRWVEN